MWLRLIRGMFATLLVLTVSGVPHHHTDHDGNLVHMDEAHGSHGTVQSLDVLRTPVTGPTTLPVATVQAIAVPALQLAGVPFAPIAIDTRPLFGRDPPGALGSRAPPLLSL